MGHPQAYRVHKTWFQRGRAPSSVHVRCRGETLLTASYICLGRRKNSVHLGVVPTYEMVSWGPQHDGEAQLSYWG